MQAWEYRRQAAYHWEVKDLEGVLNLLGADGWELCAAVECEADKRSQWLPYWVLVLKRPRSAEP